MNLRKMNLYLISIHEYTATNIDFYALGSRRKKPIHTIFVSVGQAQDALICRAKNFTFSFEFGFFKRSVKHHIASFKLFLNLLV